MEKAIEAKRSILEHEWVQGGLVASAIGLAYWAASLSEVVAHLKLETIIVKKAREMLHSEPAGFGLFSNFLGPSVLFLISASLLAYLIWHFFTTFNDHDLIVKILKLGNALILLAISVYFVIQSVHLLIYSILTAIALFIISALIFLVLGGLFSNNHKD